MTMVWVKISFWTPEGDEEIVASVNDIKADILDKKEEDFIELNNVRFIELVPAGLLDDEILSEEFDDEEGEGENEAQNISVEDEKLIEQILADYEDDEDDEDDDDDLEEIVVRLEDDFDYGTSAKLFLKREHIINFSPVREDFFEVWEATIGDEEE